MKGSEIQLFDTMKQTKHSLQTLEEGKVGLYVCGVTVYDLCHIGHARSQVAFDVIQRTLKEAGYDVTYVRNFTDVDDKIIRRSNEEGVPWKELTERNIDYFYRDMDALGIQRPQIEPKVSDHIPEIIESVEKIIENGFAYNVDGDVFYSVKSCETYGKLSGRKLDDMEAGARIEVDERKRDPMDFALWKKAKPGEPSWDSPWGKGRPGWHIECSVMSTKYLGPNFDIHGGGRDLIFPHHENERAQAISHRTDSCFSCNWMHNGFVNIGGEKMAKSLGNFFTIEELLQRFTGEALRYYLLSTHYRKPINFELQVEGTEEEQVKYTKEEAMKATRFPGLEEAARRVHYYYETLQNIDETLEGKEFKAEGPLYKEEVIEEANKEFNAAMLDDFNTPGAIGTYSQILRLANEFCKKKKDQTALRTLALIRSTLKEFGRSLGLMEQEPTAYLAAERECCIQSRCIDCGEVEALIEERCKARSEKNWQRADEIRDELLKRGITILDSPKGTTWNVAL